MEIPRLQLKNRTFFSLFTNKGLLSPGHVALGLLAIFGLYLASVYNYLFFHSLTEVFSVVIACSIFFVTWNSRKFLDNHFLLFLGIASLFVAGLDFLHLLAYRGMGIFAGSMTDSNLATQLWLAGRYLQAISLAIAPIFLFRKFKPVRFFWLYAAAFLFLVLTIFYWRVFPIAFVEGQGLTAFKKISEYIIAGVLLLSVLFLYSRRRLFETGIFNLIALAVTAMILSELSFTFYRNVFGLPNMIGHLLKIIAFYFLYKAVIESGLKKPYNLLFRGLKQKERLYQDALVYTQGIIDAVWEPMLVLDRDLKIRSANKSFFDLFKLAPEKVEGRHLQEVDNSRWNLAELIKLLKETADQGTRFYDFEVSGNFPKIGPKVFHLSGRLVSQPDNRPPLLLLSIANVTQQKKAEKQLRQSREAYKKQHRFLVNVLDSLSHPFYVINAKNRVVKIANKAAGFGPLSGETTCYKLTHDRKAPCGGKDHPCPLEQVCQTKKPVTTEHIHLDKNGQPKIFEVRSYPVFGKSGQVEEVIEYTIDITKQKNSEKQLQKYASNMAKLAQDLNKFKLAVENASDHIVITDPEGLILYANKAVERITGFPRKEILGKKAGCSTLWGGCMEPDFYKKLWQTIKIDKTIFSGELTNRRKGGEKYTAQVSVSPVLDKNKKVIFFIGIERDITEIKAVDRAKTEFISLAAHQLRTPLATLSLTAEMLLKGVAGQINREEKKYLKDMFRDIHGMADLIDIFLNVSRIEMGKFIVDARPEDPVELLEVSVEEITPQAQDKGVSIKREYDRNIPNFKLDGKALRLIMENLLANALKYTEKKGTITVKAESKDNGLLLSVIDTGYGIPEEDQEHIFEKTFRAGNIAKSTIKGMGLGLYVTKSIVDQSGGKIWFKSPVNPHQTETQKGSGPGTAFFVLFPKEGMKSNL